MTIDTAAPNAATDPAPHPDRRSANKARTRDALVDAVFTLLETEGADGLTAERVADAAGISRRTFFNYFASVDAVIASGAEDVLDRVGATLAGRPAQEALPDSAFAVISELFDVELLTQATRAWRAVERFPAARRYALEAHADRTVDLAHRWARDRLRDVDALSAAVLTASLLAAFDTARIDWLGRHTGPVDEAALDDFLATMRRAVDVLRPIVPAPARA